MGKIFSGAFIQDLRNLFDELKEEEIKQAALELIEKEEDLKYKKICISLEKKLMK
jgi:hypothetical protein